MKMIKRNLAKLAISGLGALLIVAPGDSETRERNMAQVQEIQNYVELHSQKIVAETLKTTIPTKTFNLPNINYQDYLILATTLYGEASGELDNEDYVKGVLSTILNRAEEKKSIRKAVLETTINQNGEKVYQYTCFDPRDSNYHRVMHFLNSEEARRRDSIWQQCYAFATDVLNGDLEIEHPLSLATHFFVRGYDPKQYIKGSQARRKNVPSFAYEIDNKEGKFVLDKNRNRIPLEPVAVVPVKNGKKAFFYNLGE